MFKKVDKEKSRGVSILYYAFMYFSPYNKILSSNYYYNSQEILLLSAQKKMILLPKPSSPKHRNREIFY